MKLVRLSLPLSALVFAAALSGAAHAQMPTDNDAWKARCEVLRDADPNGRGTVPAWLVKTPADVPGPKYTTFGWDRARANQHYVACTFFYLGAIADHNHGNTHADKVHAHESAVMGRIEDKLAHHQKPSVREGLTRTHAKAAEVPKPPLTEAEEEAIVAAASVVPIEPPPPAPPAPKPSPAVPRHKR